MITPDDPRWLTALLERSVLVPAQRTQHWRRVIPLLSSADRYELAAALIEVERWLEPNQSPPA